MVWYIYVELLHASENIIFASILQLLDEINDLQTSGGFMGEAK